jgi:hypothetical protein
MHTKVAKAVSSKRITSIAGLLRYLGAIASRQGYLDTRKQDNRFYGSLLEVQTGCGGNTAD